MRLKFCTVQWTEHGSLTTFDDGASAHGWAHRTPHYHVIAHRCGYGDDVVAYAREHDFLHALLEELFYNRPSRVLWGAAHDQVLTGVEAAYEEAMAQQFQRFLRANERPILSGVDWDSMRARALYLLNLEDQAWHGSREFRTNRLAAEAEPRLEPFPAT